jgi:hypothetical protein
MKELQPILRQLKDASWKWRTGEVRALIMSLGATPTDQVPERSSFNLKGFVDVSLYWNGDSAEFIEMTLESFEETRSLDPDAYEEKVDEFFAKYEAVVTEVEKVLGPPEFNDGGSADGFPDDQEAVWLALWRWRHARLMVEQKHEDRELPMRVTIVLAPPEVGH